MNVTILTVLTILLMVCNLITLYSFLHVRDGNETLKAINKSHIEDIDKLIKHFEEESKKVNLIIKANEMSKETLDLASETFQVLLKNDTELFDKIRELERLYHQIKFDMEDDKR